MKDHIAPLWDHAGPHGPQLMRAYRALETAPEEAVRTFVSLAEQGSATAMLYLADSLRHGIGVAPDAQRAEMWYRRAADGGLSRAHYHLGRLYLDQLKYPEARTEFERAASDDFAPGQHLLGRMYYFGLGVPIDKAQGKIHLELAARRGCVFARNLLAHDLIHEGKGIIDVLKGWLLKPVCYVELIRILSVEGFTSDRLR